RRTRVNAHQEHGRIGQIVPAVELHAEPVIDEEVPEVLLPLHGRLVRTAQLPVPRALVQPAHEPVITLATHSAHPGAGLFGLLTRLPSYLWRPMIRSRHGHRIPITTEGLSLCDCATPHRRLLAGFVVTPLLIARLLTGDSSPASSSRAS